MPFGKYWRRRARAARVARAAPAISGLPVFVCVGARRTADAGDGAKINCSRRRAPPDAALNRLSRELTLTRFAYTFLCRILLAAGFRLMTKARRATFRPDVCGLVFLLGAVGPACADVATPAYPAMAQIEQYRMASVSEEVSLARSAAPTSISGDAEVLTLGDHGYETAVKGKNGFICLVERSWASRFDNAGFWNPKLRAPMCYNAAGARTVLPRYLARTRMVLSDVSKPNMLERTQSAIASKSFAAPEPGAMCYMMSKQGYLNDVAGHWHPHLMFFLAHTTGPAWGADLDDSPVFSSQDYYPESITTFMVPVPNWSDGTPAGM